DGTARIWNTADGKELLVLRGHTNKVVEANFSRDGNHVVTSSDDGTARVWSVHDGSSIVLRGHLKGVSHAVFSSDAMRVATASDDGTARLWDLTKPVSVAVLNPGEELVNHVAFSPDGKRLVTSSGVLDLGSNTARFWDAATGVQIA